MAKTGPNDASGVVWALDEYFIFLFTLMLTNYLLFIQVVTYEISDKDGGDDENGLEQRRHAFVTSSTRPVLCILNIYIFTFFFDLLNLT